tara:strand:+ start:207 stop:956 length:750 start_codon:yes stop_codon:yes gene_type:complete
MQIIKKIVKYILGLLNLELHRKRLSKHFYYHVVQTLKNFKIDIVLDIGANTGQFASTIIDFGYKREILSFEPIEEAHRQLVINSKKYSYWRVYDRCGFGKKNETKMINISKNSVSSSILDIKKKHTDIAPESAVVKREKIKLITLDYFFDKEKIGKKKIFIKIDTQGYEKNIIIGSKKNIKKIKGFMVELSIVELYKSEALLFEMCKILDKLGFKIWAIERGFTNKKTGQVLQVDVIFINKNEFDKKLL